MKIEILCRSLFSDKQSDLLGVGRSNLFAYENIRQRLIVVQKFTIRGGEE